MKHAAIFVLETTIFEKTHFGENGRRWRWLPKKGWCDVQPLSPAGGPVASDPHPIYDPG